MKKTLKLLTASVTAFLTVALLSSCSYDSLFSSLLNEEKKEIAEVISESVISTPESIRTDAADSAAYNSENAVSVTEEQEIVFPEGYYSDGIYYPDDCQDSEEIFNILKAEFRKFNNVIKFYGTVDDEIFSELIKDTMVYYPELFWIKGFSWRSDGLSTEIVFNTLSDMSMDSIKEISGELDKEIVRISEMTDSGWSDYQKILFVHDYIIDNAVYDNDGAQEILDGGGGLYSSAYGCLIQGKAVCQGYADAFQLIMNRLGIECGIATGSTDRGDHAWNYVKLDDGYYWIDLTWDDPSMENNENIILHNYFLLNDEIFMKGRIPDAPDSLPECLSMKYNYFVMNELYIETYSFEDFNSRLSAHSYETDKISFLFSSAGEMEKCISEMIDDNKIWDTDAVSGSNGKISYSTDENMNIFTVVL